MDYIQIKGPIIPDSKSNRDTWTFKMVIDDYTQLFPETKPHFSLESVKRVEQELKRGRWPSLEISSIYNPLWNPTTKTWVLPQFCAKIEFVTAYKPYRGKDMVQWAMAIMNWLGVQMTTLLDRSHVSCEDSPNGEIDLALMRTSTKGSTFYESLGFTLAPEHPFDPIANPTQQLHETWDALKDECTWDNLQSTWMEGNQIIQQFQKNIQKGNDLPTLYINFWNGTRNTINTPEEWHEFMKYWLDWGYALSSLKKEYPITNSPFDIYPQLEQIPEDECGSLYNWLLILFQVFILPHKRTYELTPIYLSIKDKVIKIPGALQAQKWYILQRNTAYTTWVAPVITNKL